MAKSKFDTSFDFGANAAPRKPAGGSKKAKGKKPRSAAQRYAAEMYGTARRRR